MDLLIGNTYKRSDIHDAFGGNRQGGISPSTDGLHVFFFQITRKNHTATKMARMGTTTPTLELGSAAIKTLKGNRPPNPTLPTAIQHGW
jgi:hypothetical protein